MIDSEQISCSSKHAPFNRKIKVFQLLEWFELGGGLEKIAGEIALGLNPERFTSEIWCIDRGGKLVEMYQEKGVPVRVLHISSYFNLFNIFKLANLLKQEKPDIIHTHVYFAATIGRIAAKLAGIKVIIHHVHSTYWHYSSINLLIERWLSLLTDKIICVSRAVQDFVVTHERIRLDKTEFIDNGISGKEIPVNPSLFRSILGVEKEHVVITIVASLLNNKGHKILLEAIFCLKDKYPFIKCCIVGEGPMEKDLKNLVNQWSLEKQVIFLGVRSDVPEILSASDMFVLPSLLREGQPLSILEAMAFGVPVIASRVGGIPEIIRDQENGVLVPPQEPQLLADQIEALILDSAKRERFGQAGKKTFDESFDAKIMIKKIEELYVKSLRKKQKEH